MGFFDEDRLVPLCEALHVRFDANDRRATSLRILEHVGSSRVTDELTDAEVEAHAEIEGWQRVFELYATLKQAARSPRRGKA